MSSTLKKSLEHYGLIFLAAFAVTALANADHLFNAHGLDAWKAAAVALLVTAAKAGFSALRSALAKTALGK